MGKTLFISDLDGTLLNSNAEISPFTAKIINNLLDNGIIFTYATARGLETASKVTTVKNRINFKYPAVYHNGSCVQNPQTGEYYKNCILDKEIMTETIKKIQNNKFFPLVYSLIDNRERFSWILGKGNDELNFFLGSRENDIRRHPVKDYGELLNGDIHGVAFYAKYAEELQEIADALNLNSNEYFAYHIQEDTYKNDDGNKIYWLHIIRFDATKDIGVKEVQKLVGADKIICFGDNINDIPMFNVSDEKYAVANALDEVKNIATAVIDSNDNDGVAKWLEKNA